MRTLTTIFIIVVATPFIIIGILVFKGCSYTYFRNQVYLNTSKMQEANYDVADSIAGPALISAYYCHKTIAKKDTVPWADVFVCQSSNKKDSLKVDTIILLDTNLRNENEPKNPYNYWTGVREARKFSACKISITKDQIPLFRKYKYKYARVILVTDD